MTQTLSADEVMDAFVRLSEDEQEDLFDLLKKKRIETGRARIQADMDQARRELAEGNCRAMTPDEIIRQACEAG